MDDRSSGSAHGTSGSHPTMADIAVLVDQLLALDAVHDVKIALQREFASATYTLDAHHGPTALRRVLEKLGLVNTLKRAVVDLHAETTRAAQEASLRQVHEEEASMIPRGVGGNELDVVAAARERWEKITRDELVRFASEQHKPLLVAATHKDEMTASSTDDDMAVDLPGTKVTRVAKPPPSTRFLYDSTDLLHILQAIEPTNRVPSTPDSVVSWGLIQLQLYLPSTVELRRTFAELAPRHAQLGVDDTIATERTAFLTEKLRVGDLVIAHESMAMARQYAKMGCPASLRAALWRHALGLGAARSTETTQSHFAMLEQQVTEWTYVTDDMYLLDLQRAVDSSDYFVFQDALERVVLAFTRDPDVLHRAPSINCTVRLADAELVRLVGDRTDAKPVSACVPPNGVLPFSGLVLYIAPLAYVVGDDAEPLYFLFRELYVRYWSRLNAVATILPLCKLFEDLVQRSSPAAVFHLLNNGLSPLQIAFPWIQSAFSGVLELQQLLLLWDRVIGFDALELLAVFAAALFHWRAREWESVETMEDARALYAEILDVQAIPLLQEYLFLLT